MRTAMQTSDWFRRSAPWLVLLAIALWLLLPALSPVHVEGFSASIVALGLHYAQGSVPDFAPYAPLAADYFGLTKLGGVLGVALLSPLVGGDGAIRLLTLGAFALSLVATAYLVRRWSGAPWWLVAATMIIVPGTVETAFYFNDNLLTAGLLFAGLALLVRGPSLWSAGLAGGLVGLALLARIDTVMIAGVAVPIVAWRAHDWRRSVLTVVVSGLAATATIFALFATVGVTPFDALRAGMIQVEVWDRPLDFGRQLVELLYFVGLPAGIFALLGIFQLRRQRQWHLLALLAGIPLIINLLQLGTLWQARQFLPLLPFLTALAARGANAALDDFQAGRRVIPVLMAAFTLVVLAGPIRGLKISDGPHEYFGRLAGVALWTDWQDQVRHDFRQMDKLIDRSAYTAGAPLIVVANNWNEDRYLHLLLIERNFRRVALPGPCDLTGEGYRMGGQFVIRFAPNFPALRAKELEQTLACARLFPSSQLFMAADNGAVESLLSEVSGNRAVRPELAMARINWLSAIPLDAPRLTKLMQSYRRDAAREKGLNKGLQSLEAAHWMQRSRTAFSQ